MGEPIDGKGPLPSGPVALSVPQCAAAGACPPAGRRPARSRRARAQHLHHLLPRPAHGHFLRLRRRQVGAAVDAGAQRRGRRLGDRADRRARPRGAGVPAGRSRRGGPRPLGGGGRDLRRAGADAPPGRLSDARDRRIFPRPGQGRAGADGLGHALCHGAARDRARPPASRRPPRAIRRPCSPNCRGCWSAPARAPGEGTITGIFTRAGRRRRPQRAGRRRGARHPRRPYRDGARDRRARPLPGHQRAEIDVAHHAARRPIRPICRCSPAPGR